MNNKTELEKVKAEIESKKEEKEKYEKQLSQLKNQEKKLKKMASLEERKKRTHRLIERGAILESFIEGGIHTYAGMELRLKMYEIMKKQGHEEETGKAKITSGYNLPAKYILHTVGPIIQWEVTGKEEELLASCYRECLKLTADTGAESVAFVVCQRGCFVFHSKGRQKSLPRR